MATAELTFTHNEYARPASGAERGEASGADDGRGRRMQAELLYRIFCGEDERLQELAVRYLSVGND